MLQQKHVASAFNAEALTCELDVTTETQPDDDIGVVKSLEDGVLVVEVSSVFGILYVNHLEHDLFVENKLGVGATSEQFELVFLHSILRS